VSSPSGTPWWGPLALPGARPSSRQKEPRGKKTRLSKFVLRKRRNKVPKHSERNAREKDLSTSNCRALWQSQRTEIRYWEVIADNLKKAGLSLSWVSAVDSEGRTIWIVDAHRDDGKRYVVHADEKCTAFLELQRAICIGLLSEQSKS
jgi:hypothetical protein